jgi:hypothetical protein
MDETKQVRGIDRWGLHTLRADALIRIRVLRSRSRRETIHLEIQDR